MKLEGSLDTFSLPDVFQLLAFTKKSGGLHLVAAHGSGVVWFRDGGVTGASSAGGREAIGRRLLASASIEDEALEQALGRTAEDSAVGLARALLDADAVDEALLRELVTDATVDAAFDILAWAEGYFAFELDEPNPDDVGIRLETDHVLHEAGARRAAWDRVGGLVSPGTVLTMVADLEVDPVLSRDDWTLLALTDGRRSIGDLMELTGGGRFTVASALAGLVERGLLRALDPTTEAATVVERRAELVSRLICDEPAPWQPLSVPGVVHPSARVPEQATAPMAVVPARPEPFLPRRQVEHPDLPPMSTPGGRRPASGESGVGDVVGSSAMAPDLSALIERDPSINRSLMLRLIAGVRGL